MRAYMDIEGLSFSMSALPRYGAALAAAGFQQVQLRDRNDWYRGVVQSEFERIRGPLREALIAAVGVPETERNIELWRQLSGVVGSGELRPGHFVGIKPAHAG